VITLDRYGHLMPGHELEAVTKIDAYLDATGARTGAHTLSGSGFRHGKPGLKAAAPVRDP
jgi:hypothetical protein